MNKPAINLQDAFLNQVRKEGIAVTIYLINGFQLRGLVKGFDNFTIILDTDGKQEMVYKHAVSTIIPSRPLPDFSMERERNKTPKKGTFSLEGVSG